MLDSSFFPVGAGGWSYTVWASGMTVNQWDVVISPLDGEMYMRKTTAGAGTTDPADDTMNYRAYSFERVTQLGSAYTGGTWSPAATLPTAPSATNAQIPSISVGTRTNLLTISGRGYVNQLLFYRATATLSDPTIRIEIILDGRRVFNTIMAANTGAAQFWALFVGKITGSKTPVMSEDVRFNRSFQVYITPESGSLSANRYTLAHATRGLEA